MVRTLTPTEVATLEKNGCHAESWQRILVSEGFNDSQLINSRFEGDVIVGEGATVINSTIKNYALAKRVRVEGVTRLECRTKSCFANGVEVATINECGGRAIKIYDSLTAQIAYIWAMFRHRERFCQAMSRVVDNYALTLESEMGHVGEGSQIIGAKFIREVKIGRDVTIEGASILYNATLGDKTYIGVDVKAKDFISACGARIDSGATLERCFVGEAAIIANGFTAVDSLIFGNSHLENGEAASIFAGPYTVSHHKSSLLIAGMFSFFNAGSGSNQSNHLFKTGAVHQSIHPRGCKFASGAYIMAPAVEGAFTMVKGYHARHHDTLAFPFSYLIDEGDRSVLMPGANLVSYGTCRDIDKWSKRDRRKVKRDVINFEEHNPYTTSMMVTAVNTIHTLQEENPTSDQYIWNRVIIKPAHLKRGLGLYNKAIVSSLGDMLACGELHNEYNGADEWVDIAGQYITMSEVERVISGVENNKITNTHDIDSVFKDFANHYTDYAHSYAVMLLKSLLGHEPSAQEIAEAIESSERSREALAKMVESDQRKDCDISMSVGYGLHAHTPEEKEADYRNVRYL